MALTLCWEFYCILNDSYVNSATFMAEATCRGERYSVFCVMTEFGYLQHLNKRCLTFIQSL